MPFNNKTTLWRNWSYCVQVKESWYLVDLKYLRWNIIIQINFTFLIECIPMYVIYIITSLSQVGTRCMTLVQCAITPVILFSKFCLRSQNKKKHTRLMSLTVLLYYKGQHFSQTWRSHVEDMAKACFFKQENSAYRESLRT